MFMNGEFQKALMQRYVDLNEAICLADIRKCESMCSLGMYKKCLQEIKQHQRLPLVTVDNNASSSSMKMHYKLQGGKSNLIMFNYLNDDRFLMAQCVLRVRGQLLAYIDRISDGSVVAGSKDVPLPVDDRIEFYVFMPKNNYSPSGSNGVDDEDGYSRQRSGEDLVPDIGIPVDAKTGVPHLPWRISRKSKFQYKHQLVAVDTEMDTSKDTKKQ